MSPLLILIIFTVVMFSLLVIIRKLFGSDGLFVLGIGCIIASNVYNISAFPLNIGDLIFGLDSVIYTIFALCGLLMYIDYGEKIFKTFLYSALGSTLLTALFAFCGHFSQVGISESLIWSALSYVNSVIATLIGMYAAIWVYNYFRKSKNVNYYFSLTLALLVVTVINSLIYFGLTFLIQGNLGSAFLNSLAGSYIWKGVSILLCLICCFLGNKFFNKKST